MTSKGQGKLIYNTALYSIGKNLDALEIVNDESSTPAAKDRAMRTIKNLVATRVGGDPSTIFPDSLTHEILTTAKSKQHEICFKSDDLVAENIRLLKTLAGDTEYMALSVGQLPENVGNHFATSVDQASATMQLADHLGTAADEREVDKMREKARIKRRRFNESDAYNRVLIDRIKRGEDYDKQFWIHEVCRFKNASVIGKDGKDGGVKEWYKTHGGDPVKSVMDLLGNTGKAKSDHNKVFLMVEKVPEHGDPGFLLNFYNKKYEYQNIPQGYSTHSFMMLEDKKGGRKKTRKRRKTRRKSGTRRRRKIYKSKITGRFLDTFNIKKKKKNHKYPFTRGNLFYLNKKSHGKRITAKIIRKYPKAFNVKLRKRFL